VLLAVVAAGWWVRAIVTLDTYSPQLREVTIAVPGLTRQVDVLQVTDLGGDRFGAGQSQLAALIAGRRFDSVVLTGDIGGRADLSAVWELAALAREHSSRVWFLPGNHETPDVGPGLAQRGVITLPQDRAVPLTDSDPGAREVALAYGRTARTIASARGHGQVLLVIASHTPPDANRLAAARSLGAGTHLFIAGHTHGGQIRLPLLGAIVAPLSWAHEQRAPASGDEITFWPDLRGRLVDGMYVRDGQRVFVSVGLQRFSEGLPRFLDRAEMVAYRFVPAPGR